MSDPKDEMRARFQRDQADGSDQTDENGQTDGADQTDDVSSDPANVKSEWSHIAMYAPPDLAEEYHSFADKLDARSKLLDKGGLNKNKDINREVLEFVLEHSEEIAERMGLGADELDL